jgi:predicted Zn-ribbon and HTH transcriptional regulator
MDIQAEKIELMKLLLTTDNPSIIESIKQVFKKEKTTDFWDELTTDQQKEINQADVEISLGETTNYESFMSSHR